MVHGISSVYYVAHAVSALEPSHLTLETILQNGRYCSQFSHKEAKTQGHIGTEQNPYLNKACVLTKSLLFTMALNQARH